MTAKEYKQKHGIAKREFAKHYFNSDGLFDLEKFEQKLANVIEYLKPDSDGELQAIFEKVFSDLES